ncbi:pyridoxal phosphate-dependent decarboxylase family protein [Gaiella sp.]|uniref:pyridoxal phosphate-dependent decarboxylase family protein n=1 Tax=Gaiella sp. TaxID=2663207 RepID=UPI002C672EC6|nr:pyridoxal-dependent decarboxylase [Gaiella sp.]HWO81722.1 pyridoxal-dependent decarboxylase [Gaiella sp.]
MVDLRGALADAAGRIAEYREHLPMAKVTPIAHRREVRLALGELRDGPAPLDDVIAELVEAASPGLMASAGPRYFGFVTGGSLDAALVADVLATGWDQCAFNEALSPAAIAVEDVAGAWLKDILGLPSTASVGFVTGAQGANTVGLAAARWSVLHRHGWDVGRDGLAGAPGVRVVVGAERHATIDRAVRLLGLGERSLEVVPALSDGAMDAGALVELLGALEPGPTIVCAQTGNVNTGACDDLAAAGAAARAAGAWLHVDGAFGLWAAASPRTASLVDGVELADSWACDGHKWLNVPYDSGYAFCAHPDVHATALAYTADYLTGQVAGRELGGGDFVPESSRRARGFATWAALRSLGRSGVTELVDGCCAVARRLAAGLDELDGVEVVNEVVLNQVLVRVGDAELTDRLERAIQDDGTCWLGATTWRGERLLRVAVSNWSTTETDADLVVETIGRLRAQLTAASA